MPRAWAKESFDLGTISANFHPRESSEIQFTPFNQHFFFFFWHDARKSKEMQGWTLKIVRTFFVAESTRFFSHSLFIKLVRELFTISELFSFWKTKKNSRVYQSSKPSRVLNSRPEQYPFPRERSASCARCSCSPAPLFVQFFLF